jgi:putative SOS response-associated peptidase YedK
MIWSARERVGKMGVAGGDQFLTFATITTDANRKISTIQDRMPVIIEQQDWSVWLGDTRWRPAGADEACREDGRAQVLGG